MGTTHALFHMCYCTYIAQNIMESDSSHFKVLFLSGTYIYIRNFINFLIIHVPIIYFCWY